MAHNHSRRTALQALAWAPLLLIAANGRTARAQQSPAPASTCTTNTDDGLPESLHFVAESPHADRSCRSCTFWTSEPGGGCGMCAMLQRTTPPTGFCDSWALAAGR